jgi:hypothetical protein
MRFIRQEQIITTICNQEVEEPEFIIRLLKKLKEEGIYFALTIRKVYESDYNERTMTYPKVKVNRINEENNQADFYVYTDSSLVKMNNVAFDEISEVFALTKKMNLLDCGPDKGFFDFIDLEE